MQSNMDQIAITISVDQNTHACYSESNITTVQPRGTNLLKDNVDRDISILTSLIRVYCDNKHSSQNLQQPSEELNLCRDCQDLLEYAITRRRICPLNPKPMCRKCKIHCYAKEYRSKIREVIRFSGAYLIKHGRFDLIFHYLLQAQKLRCWIWAQNQKGFMSLRVRT